MKRFMLIFAVLLFLSGCSFVAPAAIDSIEQRHFGTILLMEGYVNLLEKYVEGEALKDRLQLIDRHLRLSKEINDYFQTFKQKEK